MKKLIHFTCYLFISFKLSAQTDTLRGLYINNFDTILGNCHKENRLLNFAKENSFNYLAIYDLHKLNLLDTPNTGIDTSKLLSDFIKKARVNFGIPFIGAVNEKYEYFVDSVLVFNSQCSNDSEKFNVFNLEFEFWNHTKVTDTAEYCKYLYPIYGTCNDSVAFEYYINQLQQIDLIAQAHNIISETYLGWFDSLQATRIVGNVDRILLHSYRTGITDLYDYTAERLRFLAKACMNSTDTMVYFVPIFSAENSFLGPWLNTHPFSSVYNHYSIDYNADTSSWKKYTTSLGHQWFAWGFLSKFSIDDPIPIITISGSLQSCEWDTVMLTSTIADHYLWSNLDTAQSIRVDTSASYFVTTGLNNCDTSNILNVVVHLLPLKPNISYPNDSMCQDTTMTLTTDSAGGYLWSTGDTLRSITVDLSDTYSVRVYSGPNCYSESDTISIHYFSRQQPIILKELLPPDSINQINPNFQLTSSVALSYNWSTNETIQNILANSARDYSLHVVDLNGCSDSASIRIDSCIAPLNTPSIYASVNCILAYGESITLSTNSADNYFWFRNGVDDNSEPSFTDSIFQPTTYCLLIYKDSFCFSHSLPMTIDTCLNTNGTSIMSPIVDYTIFPIYPNPAKNYFILPINSKKSSAYVFKILDSFGKELKIKSGKLSPGENRLLVDVNDFAKGIYFINIQIENINKTLKIVLR